MKEEKEKKDVPGCVKGKKGKREHVRIVKDTNFISAVSLLFLSLSLMHRSRLGCNYYHHYVDIHVSPCTILICMPLLYPYSSIIDDPLAV